MPYTVVSGDTLGEIAAALGVDDWRDLYVNGQPASSIDPRRLQIGSVIETPAEFNASQDEAAQTPAQEQAPADDGNATDGGTGGSAANPDPTTSLSILEGNEMVWAFDASTGRWYVQYKLPNSNSWAVFEAEPDQMDALFGPNQRPWAYEGMKGGLEGLLSRPGRVFSGNIAEMEGEGRFEDEVAKVMALALDEGTLPTWAQGDAAAMDLVYLATAEGKSQEWLYTQLSKLPSFQQRFPGLQRFMAAENLTVPQAVTAFLEFESGIKKTLDANGFNGDAFHQSQVPILLEKGYNLQVVSDAIGAFRRMKLFQPALEAFNSVLISQGFDPISDQKTFFDFVRGSAPAQYYNLWEASSIREAAATAGLADLVSPQRAIQAALAGDFNLRTSTQAMQRAAALLLRLRTEVDVGRFDLDHEELIDLSLGLKPRSGRTEAEINESVERAMETARGFLSERAKPFTGFTSTGTPQAASLGNFGQAS